MPKLKIGTKVFITLILFGIAILGFMLKLPSVFRGNDRYLHALFYFLAAGFLNLFFNVRNLFIHLAIFALLYLFGTAIEYAQEYSNSFFNARIHGRYDPEDIAWNLKGLLAFSALWLVYSGLRFFFQKPAETNAQSLVTPGKSFVQRAEPVELAAETYFLFSLPAPDLEATANFYKKYFGFSPLDNGSSQIQLLHTNLKLLLQKNTSDAQVPLQIQVQNIGALHARLSGDKWSINDPVFSPDNRLVRFRTADPAGNAIVVSAL